MISNAISKLKTEMEQNKNNSYVQVIGNFLLQHLDKNSQDADKILDKKKTILKSLDEMRIVAQKTKVGNCAVLTDQEGFAVVLKYFGIEQDGLIQPQAAAPVMQPSTPAPPPKSDIDFDVKLEDLLQEGGFIDGTFVPG